jgi:hypothetical protein
MRPVGRTHLIARALQSASGGLDASIECSKVSGKGALLAKEHGEAHDEREREGGGSDAEDH